MEENKFVNTTVWTWDKIKLPGNTGSLYLILFAQSKLFWCCNSFIFVKPIVQ